MVAGTIDADLGKIPAEEAFSIIGHATRLDVLRALWKADGALPFADLRERVAP